MKKLLVIGLIVLAGLWLVRKTHIASYAGTLWCQMRQEAKAQVPTRFELDRIRHEIAQMDNDIRNMVSPIAEHMATIARLRRDIEQNEATLADRKAGLLTLTTSLDKGTDPIDFRGQRLTPERARHQMRRDFNSFKLLQTQLATHRKLLDAKEKALDGTREQLNKLIAKKRDFEVQLANLEAREQMLTVARTGTDLLVDDSRATKIKSDLEGIEHRMDVEQNKLDLINAGVGTTSTPAPEQGSASPDEVRAYIEGRPAGNGTKTASSR
jgi:chromosome segregation ATPase